MKIRELIRKLEEDGWRHMRTRGRHCQFNHSEKRGVVTVPGKPNDDLARGL